MANQTLKSRRNVAVVCGGVSSEHEISCVSAGSIMQAIDKNRFNPILIGITKSGRWKLLPADTKFEITGTGANAKLPHISEEVNNENEIFWSRKGAFVNGKNLEIDVAFPILHGPFGEDGTIQGLFEMWSIPYVGSKVLASAICMDKSFAKAIFAAAGLKTVPGTITTNTEVEIPSSITYPLFVKPARGGSSRGTIKVKSASELKSAISNASQFDQKVLVEQAIKATEIECAILESGGKYWVSNPGQIKLADKYEFYDFEAKYLDNSMQLVVPAQIDSAVLEQIKDLALRAFKAANCSGLARVDFFYSDKGEIFINEINTMPGFTPTSVYPKLMQQIGISYSELITKLLSA
jgi:D-alanine-D-alanine ligase